MIKSKILNQFKNIEHGFFDKKGGKSSGIYKSLNCGSGSFDKKINIKKNLNIVLNKIKYKKKNLILLNQMHSNKFYYLKKNPKKRLKGDGILTNYRQLALGILTADCAPIFFYDPKKKIIGAAHAGWRGAISGIIEHTVTNMVALGSNVENIKCAIGPCISENSYYVRDNFYKLFTLKNRKNAQFFNKVSTTHYLFSLKEFIKNNLKLLKISDIFSIDLDTFSEENLCFSNRRSILKKENDYGRMISTIVIKDY